MNFFKATAFTKLHALEASGNPAYVVIFEESEEMDAKVMAQIASTKFEELMITAFVKRRGDTNHFDLRYYTQHGVEWEGLCGHATICTSAAIKKNYALPENVEVVFHVISGMKIKAKITDKAATINLPTADVKVIENDNFKKKFCEIFKIKEDVVEKMHKSTMRDFVILLNKKTHIRDIEVDLDLLEKYALELDYRGIALVQNSDVENMTFDIRVFSHLVLNKRKESGEDVACGSLNCSIAPVVNRDSYTVIFPYLYKSTGILGGLESIVYDKETNSINLTGEYKLLSMN
jgi:PhzF family phenazine biosynthesis protein